ncbi:MAG: DUF465 domain-containing protein [Rhodospirillales bacterium]|nr:MAG: DUF465 domain-containing protein [Rhodospirillales bacterium]
MSVLDRVDALKTRHAALEQAIHEEAVRPHPNEETLQELKRKKLKLKDEIEILATRH